MSLQTDLDRLHTTWFGPNPREGVPEGKNQLWFGKDPDLDRMLRDEFGDLHQRVTGGDRDGSLLSRGLSPRRTLALILLYDQVTRNLYRGEPESFDQDDRAMELARSMVDSGEDLLLSPVERVFVYMPFEHAENLEDQNRSVALFDKLVEDSPEEWKHRAVEFLDYARQHYEVIERFGRFPHRNEILGRQSTPEELDYLEGSGGGF